MQFINTEHEMFYNDCLEQSVHKDVYHKTLFYALGLTKETRRNIKSLYDFKNREINFDGLNAAWHTSTSIKVVRLAFNLFNGFNGNVYGKGMIEESNLYTPYELFDTELTPYFFQAIRLRYPN